MFDKDGYAFSFDRKRKYGWRCLYPEGLTLGTKIDIASNILLNARHGITIGDDTQIGPFCVVLSDNTENNTHGPVVIGKNCKIGSFCLILPNSVIPDNTKLRAYSIWKQ